MSITAKIITDSVNLDGDRLTTFVLTFPRYILAEFNTHRVFSRNSASSRAIPFEKMIKSVEENPFIPIAWQKNHKGMQGTEYFTNEKSLKKLKKLWLRSRDSAVREALEYDVIEQYINTDNEIVDVSLTKQIINRLLEPFMWHTVIVTASEYENFFALRCPQYVVSGYPADRSPEALEPSMATFRSKKDAIKWLPELESMTEMDWFKCNEGMGEIHIMALAEAMWDALKESTPNELEDGEWHIPFGDNFDQSKLEKLMPEIQPASMNWYFDFINDLKVKIASARCARVSYTVVGEENKETDYSNDIKLHDRLAESGHASPLEHCAQASCGIRSRNFNGFLQYREICGL